MHPSLLVGKSTHRDLSDLLSDKRRLIISGTSNETAKALLISSLHTHTPQPALMVTSNNNHTEALSHWLDFFELQPKRLEPIENENEEIVPEAMQEFLLFMSEGHTHTFLCDRDTWDSPFPLHADLLERKIPITTGQNIAFTSFVESLIDLGYRHGEDLY